MIIERLEIENFRSLKNVTVNCEACDDWTIDSNTITTNAGGCESNYGVWVKSGADNVTIDCQGHTISGIHDRIRGLDVTPQRQAVAEQGIIGQ